MHDVEVRHRLLAILAADAVGYSRLMAGDDVGALRSLDAAREIFRTRIEAHDGWVIDMAGDSVLAVFETVSGAVNTAREVQESLTLRGDEVPGSIHMQFRIGIHLGDVLEKADGTVYGDGVNIAARLQALAEPGGITVSHAVRDAVFNRVSAEFEDLGEQVVKNIPQPVQAFRMHWDRITGAIGATGASAPVPPVRAASRVGATRRGVALGSSNRRWWAATLFILVGGFSVATWIRSEFAQRPSTIGMAPLSLALSTFSAPTGDLAAEQFARTLRRDLLTGLAAVERSVKTMQADSDSGISASATPSNLARPNARYLVEGDVERGSAGITVVSLRMIDVPTRSPIWGERFELSDAGTAFESATQRRNLVKQLAVAVWNAESRRVMSLPRDRLSAAELVLLGTALWTGSLTLEGLREVSKLYDAALGLEPNLLLALIYRSDLMPFEIGLDSQADRSRIARRMDELTTRALQLDGSDPWVWDSRTRALGVARRWNAAIEASDQTIRLDPYYPRNYTAKASLLIAVGRPADALSLAERAMAMNPSSAHSLRVACDAHLLLGHDDEAIAACERAAGLIDFWDVHLSLAAAYANKGDMGAAARARAQVLKVVPGYTVSQLRASSDSDVPEYLRLLEKYVLPGLRKAGFPE